MKSIMPLFAIVALTLNVSFGGETPHKEPVFKAASDLVPRGLGHVEPAAGSATGALYVSRSRAALPATFDLSASMPLVGDQGQQGSCAAWTTAYAIKSFYERADSGLDITQRSNAFSPAYVYNQTNGGQDNGSNHVINFGLIYRRGAAKLSDMPYNESNFTLWPTQAQSSQALKFRNNAIGSSWYGEIDKNDLQSIKSKLYEGNPLYIAFRVDDNLKTSHLRTSSYVWYPGANISGGHAVTVIGWDDNKNDGAGHVGALKIQNSWGTSFGDQGYFWIAYDALGTTSVFPKLAFCSDRAKYAPSIEARVKVDHTARGTLNVVLGVGSSTSPDASFQFYGTSRNFVTGTDTANANIYVTLDASDFQAYWPPSASRKWWIKVEDSQSDGKAGQILEFALVKNNETFASSTAMPASVSDQGSTFAFVETGTGTPNDTPVVTISASDNSAAEQGAATGVFTVTRSGSTAAAMTINLSYSGSATSGTDYQSPPGSVTIPAGSSSATITITPSEDTVAEGDETVVATVTSGAGYNVGTPSNDTVTIADNDGDAVVTILTDVANASEAGPTPGGFLISRSGTAGAALTVNFSVGGTATSVTDYTSLGTSITIPANQSSVKLTVTPVSDGTADDNETVIVTLGSGTGYRVGSTSRATVTIKESLIVRPANDNFANRITINGSSATVNGTNVDATAETGEPAHAGSSAGNTVWWTWTPASSGYVAISTEGSDFDTVLAVYTGTSVSGLTLVDSNDDFAHFLTSKVTLPVTAGTVYQIAVGGAFTDSLGAVTLSVGAALPTISVYVLDRWASEVGPENGNFAIVSNVVLNSPLTVNFSVAGTATSGADYTALPASVTIPAGSSGTNINVVPITDGVADPDETVEVSLTTATTYVISTNQPSTGTVTIKETATIRPGNDDFANATSISGSPFSNTVDTTYATGELGEPAHAGIVGNASVWYKLNATQTGTLTVSTASSGYDTLLAAYSGSALTSLTLLASNDDEDYDNSIYTSLVRFPVSAGTTYYIAIDGYEGDAGALSLSVSFSALPIVYIKANKPLAEEFNAVPGQFTISRTGATTAALLVKLQIGGTAVNGIDVAPLPESVTIPAGAGSITLDVKPFDDAEREGYEYVLVDIQSSVDYLFGTSLASYDYVDIRDNESNPPINDNFAGRITLTGTRPYLASGTNVDATREAGEPKHAGNNGGSSVWWAFTVTADTSINVSTAGSAIDTVVAVYTGTSVDGLTVIASNDDEDYDNGIYTSRASFTALANVTYLVAVDGYDGATGRIALTVTSTSLPIVSVDASVINATESGSKSGYFTVRRSGSLVNPLTVSLNFAGVATNGTDYEQIANSVTIPAGLTYLDIAVKGKDDSTLEGSESVIASVQANSAYIIAAPNSASVSLNDDEVFTSKLTSTSPASATPNPAKINETVTFSVTPNSSNALVTWDFGDGTTGTGATATHEYAAAGTYSAHMTSTLNNGVTSDLKDEASLSITVKKNVLPAYAIKRKFTLNFGRTFKDSIDFTLTTNGNTFVYFDRFDFQAATDGKTIKAFVGDTQIGSATLFKGKGTGTGKFTWTARKGTIRFALSKVDSLKAILEPYNVTNDDVFFRTVFVPFSIEFEGTRYGGTYKVFYKAKRFKTGTGKY
ncbi:MAG TPA: Calx-beta domain-containing protein [Planctomycetota bacterium]|nr:Calx-beta domain-containing protein [Planctomycetota bacterium]